MSNRKLKPFRRVIYKTEDSVWTCGWFSHEDSEKWYLIGGISLNKETSSVLLYDGNEMLVGTNDEPEEEFVLEKGELIFAADDQNKLLNGFAVLGRYSGSGKKSVIVKLSDNAECSYEYCIPYDMFNPTNKAVTKKSILCVKNRKLVNALYKL